MTKSWAPMTQCQMRCKDCSSDLPYRTYYHSCDGAWRRSGPTTGYIARGGLRHHVNGVLRVQGNRVTVEPSERVA